jgi:hypothetical protein
MTERSEVIIRLSPSGRGASSRPDQSATRNGRMHAAYGEEVA